VAVTARRLSDQPIIRPGMDARMGGNINGPSIIKMPSWAASPLGRYHLYFADHKGRYIRLAYGDAVEGPWAMHPPGCLDVTDSLFCADRPSPPGPPPEWAKGGQDWLYPHVASPDAHVDQDQGRIRMYFHGLLADGAQMTRVGLSRDGLAFEVLPDLLGPAYFRVFRYGGWWYALAYPNVVLRSQDGLRDFETGPVPLDPATRHSAALPRGHVLHVVWTRFGDAPERIFHGTIDLAKDWRDWRLSAPTEVLRPERRWEGGDLPLKPSVAGAAEAPVNELRDPCLFEDGGRVFLLYSGAGEGAIGIAELSGI